MGWPLEWIRRAFYKLIQLNSVDYDEFATESGRKMA